MNKIRLIGPFRQLLTMDGMSAKGPLSDIQLEIIENAGIIVNGEIIESVGPYRELMSITPDTEKTEGDLIAIPGMIDAHTHICWAGTRANDFAMRLSGKDYLDIARKGGGILNTVNKTRESSKEELTRLTAIRADRHLSHGITTIEVKSGYGLDYDSEIKMLNAIRDADEITKADLIPTCLAAHTRPKEFTGTSKEYLEYLVSDLLPVVKVKKKSKRVDVYIDKGAFTAQEGRYYIDAAKKLGFDIVVHADQFFEEGLQVAVDTGAVSADHLEASGNKSIELLAQSNTIPVVLPGSSLGLGTPFAPARKLLNAGTSLVIASDWNPGTAPMGLLLTQASVLGVNQNLTMAEILAALTFRAASALRLQDRGIIRPGMLADFIAFPCSHYREIIYNQGALLPAMVWKRGLRL